MPILSLSLSLSRFSSCLVVIAGLRPFYLENLILILKMNKNLILNLSHYEPTGLHLVGEKSDAAAPVAVKRSTLSWKGETRETENVRIRELSFAKQSHVSTDRESFRRHARRPSSRTPNQLLCFVAKG